MICFFNTARAWGGGEKWHFDMATRLQADGFEVLAVTHTRSELGKRLKARGLEPVTVDLSNASFLSVCMVRRLRCLFTEHRVGTIILNLPADLKAAGMAARLAGVPRIIYRRGSAIPVRNSFFNRFLFRYIITDVLVNSRATQSTILANNSKLIEPDRITVIYNGLVVDRSCGSRDEVRPAMAGSEPPNAPFVIGSLGRLEREKAQHLLVELGARLNEAGLDFKIVIGGDGKLKNALQKQIEARQLEKHVLMIGHVDDVRSFMQGVDVFVLTSHWEGFGYVLAEAMACERPVIAFDHSSGPEVVEHGKTGLLAKPGDMDDLLAKTICLMEDRELSMAMGKAGREKVLRDFDFEQTYAQFKSFLGL